MDAFWIPEGTGGVTIMPQGGLGNEPGYGAAAGAGPYPNAQTLRVQISEQIAGTVAAPPTTTQLATAATQFGTDLGTILQNNVAQIDGWATGGG